MKAEIAAGLLALMSCGNVGLTEGEALSFDRKAEQIHTWTIQCTYHVALSNNQEYRYPVVQGVFTGDQALCEQSLKMTLWSHMARFAYNVAASYSDCFCKKGSLNDLKKDLPCPYAMSLR
jgi:hypothetical protein